MEPSLGQTRGSHSGRILSRFAPLSFLAQRQEVKRPECALRLRIRTVALLTRSGTITAAASRATIKEGLSRESRTQLKLAPRRWRWTPKSADGWSVTSCRACLADRLGLRLSDSNQQRRLGLLGGGEATERRWRTGPERRRVRTATAARSRQSLTISPPTATAARCAPASRSGRPLHCQCWLLFGRQAAATSTSECFFSLDDGTFGASRGVLSTGAATWRSAHRHRQYLRRRWQRHR